jgi:hypothetical protein
VGKNKKIIRMELKNFVDFAYSLVNMEEVKEGTFKLPKEIVFELDENQHINIHREIKEEKKETNYENLNQEFDVDIFDITFRFKS